MPAIKRAKHVRHLPSTMYELVNDVTKYKDFVPWCTKSEILRESDTEVEATLTFSKGGLERSFSTVNSLKPGKMIKINLLDGPFEHLGGFWQFEQRGAGCLVILDLDFEFNNAVTRLMFGPFFNQLASLLVDTFCKRADALYGDAL